MLHTTLSRKGGQARSEAKTKANRAKATAFWETVRAGQRPAPQRHRCPPAVEEIARRLEPYCRAHGVVRLEVFGSLARGEARQGSDVDLIATFVAPVGLKFFEMADDMARLLGVPVDLIDRAAVDRMTNPYRKASILADVRPILSL